MPRERPHRELPRVTNANRLAAQVREGALALGFDRVGITTPAASAHMDFYRAWIGDGAEGEMAYLSREDSLARRSDLRLTMATVRSVVLVAHDYFVEDPPGVPHDPSRAVLARYARGDDYHDVIKDRLIELLSGIEEAAGRRVVGRAYVDTGPILERELGARAGLGWFGKNTMLIHPRAGSYFFLGVLLLDLELAPDPPFAEEHCGTCRSCLDACPTHALLGRDECGAPVMDARRCISYLTIEHRGPIPRDLRPLMGNRVYGCDICQEVCPWNERFAEPTQEVAYRVGHGLNGPSLVQLAEELLAMDAAAFGYRFSGSPIKRAKREGLLRNVCVGLGNWGAGEAVPPLAAALSDPADLVRGHAAWALGRIAMSSSREALVAGLDEERDPWVRTEIALALASANEG